MGSGEGTEKKEKGREGEENEGLEAWNHYMLGESPQLHATGVL